MSNISINGTFLLTIANLVGKVFGAIYRIPLSNMLGTNGIGLYQIAFPLYSFFLTFLTGGISVVLSKNIANLRAKDDVVGVYKQFKMGFNTSVVLGLLVTIVLLLFAYPLSVLQGNSNAYLGYLALSIGFIFACLLGVYRGYYQGYNNMAPTAISQIIEQATKLVFGLILAFLLLKWSVTLGVCGALLGVSISEIITFVYFVVRHKKNKSHTVKVNKNEYRLFVKEFFPISCSYGILPLSSLIDSFLIINLLTLADFTSLEATSIYGIETGMILPLINIPNVLITALAIATVPKISYKIAQNKQINNEIKKIVKVVTIFIIPSMVGMFFFAEQIISIIYPTLNLTYKNLAINLLKLSVFEMFFICFVSITNSVLQSMGMAKKALFSTLFGVLIKIILEIILVKMPQINIMGLVIAGFIGYFLISTINVMQIKRKTQFSINFSTIICPIFSSFIMGGFILIYKYAFKNNMGIVPLLIGVIISVVIYFFMLVVLKQLKPNFFKNLLQSNDV